MLDRLKLRLEVGWAAMAADVVRDPLGAIAVTFLSFMRAREVPPDPQVAEWTKNRMKEIDQTYRQRRRQGMEKPLAERIYGNELLAISAELKERYHQGIYPYNPPEHWTPEYWRSFMNDGDRGGRA